jgi:hypothetical protein
MVDAVNTGGFDASAVARRWAPSAPAEDAAAPTPDGAPPSAGAPAAVAPGPDANVAVRQGTGSLAGADLGDAPWDQAERAAADEALAAGPAAEAYEGLSDAQRRQAQDVYRAIPDQAGKDAFTKALAAGKLTASGKIIPNEKDALGYMADIAAGPLGEGLDAGQVLGDLSKNLADPFSIGQGGKNTCIAAYTESGMALEEPAEYARLAAGLTSEAGTVTTRAGLELKREDDGGEGPGPDRNALSQLFQNSLMELGNGDADFDAKADKSTGPDGEQTGLSADAGYMLWVGLHHTPEDHARVAADPDRLPKTFDDWLAGTEKNMGDGRSRGAFFDTPDGGHMVRVLGMDGDKVTIYDSAKPGAPITMSKDQLREYLTTDGNTMLGAYGGSGTSGYTSGGYSRYPVPPKKP